jgi:hypothetical protein
MVGMAIQVVEAVYNTMITACSGRCLASSVGRGMCVQNQYVGIGVGRIRTLRRAGRKSRRLEVRPRT